jgi:hypothetical protein
MEESINIYLDQKDYSRIARGLYGEESYKPYIAIYNYLKNLSDSGRIKIFFSWTHIIESLRYHDLTGELWRIHCNVVDTLTKGNCIIFPAYLEERELELFLSDNFGIESQYSKSSYVFGFYKDAVPLKKNQDIPFSKYFEDAIKKHISASGLSRNDRRLFLKKFTKKKYLREFFSSMSEDDFRRLVGRGEKADQANAFISDLSSFLDRETFINFVVGTTNYRSQIFDKFIDHIFNFKTLVNTYSQIFPELRQMAQFPDKTFKKLNSIINSAQLIQNIFSKPAIDPDQLKADLINKFVTSVKPSINDFAKKHKFSKKEAESILIESHFIPIPSIYSTILFSAEYAKRHVGVTKRARKPRKSDVMDLHNLRNLPYVDLFVTDNFFAEIVGRIAKAEFGTRIFRNLFQLKEFLENN